MKKGIHGVVGGGKKLNERGKRRHYVVIFAQEKSGRGMSGKGKEDVKFAKKMGKSERASKRPEKKTEWFKIKRCELVGDYVATGRKGGGGLRV